MKNGVFIIGVTGRSGCGKGYVCEKFSCRGIPTIDTDAVYHSVVASKDGITSECLSELVREFGSEIIDDNGILDRRALAAIVFADGAEDRLKMLNSITHKYILCETLRLISEYSKRGVRAVTIDAPVLFESSFDSMCDLKICVSAPTAVSVSRICNRDKIGENEALARLASQKSEAELVSLCNEVIINDDIADIPSQVNKIIDKYSLERK